MCERPDERVIVARLGGLIKTTARDSSTFGATKRASMSAAGRFGGHATVVGGKIGAAMSDVPIPDYATGRPGMVAMVHNVRGLEPGRLVVLREPAGFLTVLVGRRWPVFSWLVQVLGEPVEIEGKPTRQIYLPDRCLTPVSTMNSDQVDELIKEQARQGADAAIQELSTLMGNTTMTGPELDQFIDRAAEQIGIERALAVVATPVVLREAGFRVVNPGGDLVRWVGLHNGVELHIDAGPDMFAGWVVHSAGRSAREFYCDETWLPSEGPRGQLLERVLKLWQSAFPDAPVPASLAPGAVYAQHRDTLSKAAKLPRLVVDPEMFRAVRRWLVKRFPVSDELVPARLSHADGLLRIDVDRSALACPAQGLWADACEFDLVDLLTIDPSLFRRRSLIVELDGQCIRFNGAVVPIR